MTEQCPYREIQQDMATKFHGAQIPPETADTPADLKVAEFQYIAPVITDIVHNATEESILPVKKRFLGKLIAPWDYLAADLTDHFKDQATTVFRDEAHQATIASARQLHQTRIPLQSVINPNFESSIQNGPELAITCCLGIMRHMKANGRALVEPDMFKQTVRQSSQHIDKLTRTDPLQTLIIARRMRQKAPQLPPLEHNSRRGRFEFTTPISKLTVTPFDQASHQIYNNDRRTTAQQIGDIRSDLPTPGCPIILGKTTKQLWEYVVTQAEYRGLLD